MAAIKSGHPLQNLEAHKYIFGKGILKNQK